MNTALKVKLSQSVMKGSFEALIIGGMDQRDLDQKDITQKDIAQKDIAQKEEMLIGVKYRRNQKGSRKSK